MHNLSFPLQRAFIALPLEGEAKKRFHDLQNSLNEYENIFRFQNPDSPHLTLYYWNELMQIEFDDVVKKLETIASKTSPFTIQVNGVEASGKPPKVLWMTIDRSDELARLKKLCPWPNTRPFHPHVTVARMRNPNDFIVHQKKIMKLFKNISLRVQFDRIRLYGEVEGVRQTEITDIELTQ